MISLQAQRGRNYPQSVKGRAEDERRIAVTEKSTGEDEWLLQERTAVRRLSYDEDRLRKPEA